MDEVNEEIEGNIGKTSKERHVMPSLHRFDYCRDGCKIVILAVTP